MSIELSVKSDYSGYLIDGIEATNNGDLTNLLVTQEILSSCETLPIHVFDIGADKGAWALSALYFCPKAEISCFEPNIKTFEISSQLQKKYPSLKWYNVAISDSSGTIHLFDDGSNSHSRQNPDFHQQFQTMYSIEKYPISKFLTSTDFISLIKIDTEGHDIVILKNLLPFLQKNQIGSIITEFTIYWYGESPKDCLDNSKEILYSYFNYFSHIYCLARTFPVFLLKIEKSMIDEFCLNHYYRHIQTDLLFTNCEMKSVPIYPYGEHILYAGGE